MPLSGSTLAPLSRSTCYSRIRGNKPSALLHESLDVATVDTPLVIALKVDERRKTSIPGVHAVGDLANPLMASVTTASWQGSIAGIFA